MPSSWRGRSSTTTITSRTSVPLRSATSSIVSPSGRSRSSRSAISLAAGDLLHVHARAGVEHRAALGERDHGQRVGHAVRGQPRALQRVDRDVDLGRRRRRRRARRCRASAPRPSRPRRSPRCRPSGPVGSTACIPSTAAWSAASLSPRPSSRAAASAAASVTRTSSSARLRSQAWLIYMTPGGLRLVGLAGGHPAADDHQDRTQEGERRTPVESRSPRSASPAGRAKPGVADQPEGGDADHRGQLAARPRQLVLADRRSRRG